jgi:hypothetical protein
MFKVNKDELSRMRMLNNQVLIKIDMFNEKIVFADNSSITIDMTFEPQDHITAIGKVIKVPSRLTYSEKNGESNAMEWETPMDLREGDTVYMDYLEVMLALGMKANKAASYPMESYFEVDNELYIIITYAALFFAVRNDRVIMLNGFVMAEPVEVKIQTAFMVQLGMDPIDDTEKTRWARVLESGSVVTRHKAKKFHPQGMAHVGDLIFFKLIGKVRAERKMHQIHLKGRNYFIIQSWWIYALVTSEYADQYIEKIKTKELV